MTFLLVGVLATWRITAFLVYEHWTEGLRQRAEVDFHGDDDLPVTFAGKILGCFWCTAQVVGLVVALAMLPFLPRAQWVLMPFALAGGAIILNHWTRIVRDAEH